MLARNAQALYWLGRYLERADHVCRVLQLQVAALVDKPVDEIEFGWRRIYFGLKRLPPGGLLSHSRDELTLADSFTLAGDLTFEPSNPDSLRNCFDMARENARQMRHCISTEMWLSLNRSYLEFKPLDLPDIWKSSPEEFYADATRDFRAFFGISEATMYRDAGWHFLLLGRMVERTQLSISLLAGHDAAASEDQDARESDLVSLLRIFHAMETYTRKAGSEFTHDAAFAILATDEFLPSSVIASCEAVAACLSRIDPGPEQVCSKALRSAGRLRSLVAYELPDAEDRSAALAEAEAECRALHDILRAGYFEYAADNAPEH